LLTIVVALAIVAAFLFERWLDWRQVRYVAAHREEVPAAFAGRISLEDHQKAADYTIAKQRLGLKQDIAGAVLSMVLLAGGGFALLQSAIAATFGSGAHLHQLDQDAARGDAVQHRGHPKGVLS
jgi:STE24 endopeptidase